MCRNRRLLYNKKRYKKEKKSQIEKNKHSRIQIINQKLAPYMKQLEASKVKKGHNSIIIYNSCPKGNQRISLLMILIKTQREKEKDLRLFP